ncbi:DUF4365 domain-containing protein [Niallia endozanthoxylica]|uniref:DUF4365 domain-containing protein n=1 Tax=Niallia endozanthoxylica TaxID=2036016 RepID=A0A5J5HBJ4_9BACI|nr:DUF4365 domain-containing protein [Niallia endozanthoxylica]KAA9017980.1 DUF4365 domain-containing protein [Niallia endozanthoxylica]
MRTKRKSHTHLIEKKSLEIVGSILPDYWTIREYKPDYGIDLEIELFEPKDEDKKRVYDTLGEHIFIQVKGTENIDFSTYTIHERKNVEMYEGVQGKPYKKIDVVKFQLDTAELYTVERMSSAVPILLFVVDVNNENIYFLCLNDYIEKVLVPTDPEYYKKKSKTIYIPKTNILNKNNTNNQIPIMLYAKRPKLYSFFNKINYQAGELKYLSEDELLKIYPHFLQILLRLDVWEIRNLWAIMGDYFEKLNILCEKGKEGIITFSNVKERDGLWETNFSFSKEYTFDDIYYFTQVRLLWEGLNGLGNLYEDIVREWFLPTYLNELLHE